MNLETLQHRWTELDQDLDERLQRHAGLLRRLYLQTVQAPLRRRSWAIGAEIALNVAALLLLGSFLFHHIAAPSFLLPGVGLYLFALWQLVGSLRQPVALRTLDYSGPLVTLQQRLARLRVQSLTQLLWTVALSPLLWPLLLIVGLKGLLGVDAYVARVCSMLPTMWPGTIMEQCPLRCSPQSCTARRPVRRGCCGPT